METMMRITAGCSSQLDLALYFPNKIGIVWAVGGNGEARAISIADVAGYNSIHCLSLRVAAAAQHWFTSFFFRNFKPSDVETTWF